MRMLAQPALGGRATALLLVVKRPSGVNTQLTYLTYLKGECAIGRAAMTTTQLLTLVFVTLIVALMLPWSHAVRMGIFVALIALAALTFLGGGAHFFLSMF
jgi:hypothetical protein